MKEQSISLSSASCHTMHILVCSAVNAVQVRCSAGLISTPIASKFTRTVLRISEKLSEIRLSHAANCENEDNSPSLKATLVAGSTWNVYSSKSSTIDYDGPFTEVLFENDKFRVRRNAPTLGHSPNCFGPVGTVFSIFLCHNCGFWLDDYSSLSDVLHLKTLNVKSDEYRLKAEFKMRE